MDLFSVNTDDLFIIDTDCGSDDAIAILLALIKCPSQVIAFTCCYGNAPIHQVCQNVMKVMVACNQKQIPVYKGCAGSLLNTNIPFVVHGSDGFGDCGQEFSSGNLKEETDSACFGLINLTKKYPGRITLIALAPLTNLAITHRIDPEFTKRLKSIVCMGGNYRGVGNVTETAEFNFYCDPVAADIILTESKCPITLVPWETTEDHGIDWTDFEKLLNKQTKTAYFIKRTSSATIDFCRKEESPTYPDCDLMATVAALYPACVKKTIKRTIRVECKGEFSTGLCICSNVPPGCATDKKSIDIVTEFNIPMLTKLREDIYNYNTI
ncbi:nucleoside hydrolase [Parasteatoda tepidariorum]|nr:uncharacterized protein C1683.06c [Parasteatoda tepidariorum]XP_015906579.2 uncharacterized protein C1683.06c [Parasteatoda tepidariorum]XP_015906580.2 uncharacterized protein C1683.06c [Parasteatoda tepidariorum]